MTTQTVTLNTIDLDDRAWFDAIPVGGIGVHVVEGVRVVLASSPETGEDCPTGPDRGSTPRPLHPPLCRKCQWPITTKYRFGSDETGWEHMAGECLVPLSEQKCETCKGRGFSLLDPDWPCPDCLGSGRPLVQVTVPCPTCGGRTWHTAGGHDPMDCGRCDVTGRVSTGSVTVEAVVPIVHFIDWDTSRSAIVIDDMGHAIYFRVDGDMVDAGVRVDLGPNPEQYVGKFGVIVRRVS